MKKVISLALSALLALSLAACGGSNTTTVASSTESSGSSTEAAQTEAPESEETPAAKSEFQEQTIVDNEYCTVILKGTDDRDGMFGYSLKVYLENKTADKTLLFGMDNTSVNGVMVDPLWGATVAPGKKSNETISWLSTSLEKNNIKADDITQVSFTLNVYDKDDLAADEFVDDDFVIYPKGEEKATKPKHEIQPTDIVLFDNNACSMVVCGFYSDSFMGYTAKAYYQNKTDDRIDIILDKGSINGFECTPEGTTLLEPHSNAYIDIRWQEYAETYAENGNDPTSITKIVMPVFVRKDTGSNTVYIDATYSIDPQARTATPIVNPQ